MTSTQDDVHGYVFLEIEDDTEYVKISSPNGEIICKFIFNKDDKIVLLNSTMQMIQDFCDDFYPGEQVEFRFSEEWMRIFAGVAVIQIQKEPPSPLTIIMLVVMIGYELISWIF